MRIVTCRFFVIPVMALCAAVLAFDGGLSYAQNKDFNLEVHANSHAGAKDVGLPAYPGATLVKGSDDDSNADLGFAFGKTHFRLVVAKYTTTDSPDRILAFYRKPLSIYGEVLECNQGKPTGAQSATRSGLTCSEQKDGGVTLSDDSLSSNHHELRAGSPHQFRIVWIDESGAKATRFVLIYIDSPKDDKNEDAAK
ncbi:MAG: hypothetical protein ABSG60_02975 [Terracidiphilus sp.]